MDRLVAAGRPARALLESQRVIGSADQDLAGNHLLKMAFEAKIGVANGKELGVDRAVSGVTDRATFPHGFVLEDVRAALRGMATETALVERKESCAATDKG